MTVPSPRPVDQKCMDALDRLAEELDASGIAYDKPYGDRIATALATLRDLLASQEQELERLRDERDTIEREIDEMDSRRVWEWERAEAAEVENRRLKADPDGAARWRRVSEKPTDRVDWALGEARRMVSERPHSPQARSAAVLADEVCRLREERDALIRDRERWRLEWQAEVVAAEAEVRRLTEGLREIAESRLTMPGIIRRKAEALLAASPPDGGGAK